MRIWLMFVGFVFLLHSCGENKPTDEPQDVEVGFEFRTFDQKIAYCIGLDHANGVVQVYGSPKVAANFNMREIEAGLIDYISGNDLKVDFILRDSILDSYLQNDGTVNESLYSKEEASYAVGMEEAFGLIGALVSKEIDQIIDVDYLIKGIQDGLEQKDPLIDPNVARKEVQSYYAELNLANGERFLEENKTMDGVIVTESGLQYSIVKPGVGNPPNLTDSVMVHYTGYFIDGRVFESTIPSKVPATFTLMGLVQGWQEGLQLMGEGAQHRLYVPYQLAYGEKGSGPVEPYSTLVFDIELIKIKRFSN